MPIPAVQKIVAEGGIQIPASAAAGRVAKSDVNGNISWGEEANDLPANAIAGALAETFPRVQSNGSGSPLTSGTLMCTAMGWLRPGRTYSGVKIPVAGTAAGTPTNSWVCLINVATLAILAVSADQGAGAWGANAVKSINFATPYTPAAGTAIEAYLGIMVKATAVPSVFIALSLPKVLADFAPAYAGNSNAGLTTPLAAGTVVNTPVAVSPQLVPYAILS